MDISSVMHEFRKRDIALCVEGDNLRVKALDAVLTDELRQMIRDHKAELIALLVAPPWGVPSGQCAQHGMSEVWA